MGEVVKKIVKQNFQLRYGLEQCRLCSNCGKQNEASRDLDGSRLCRITKTLWLIASYQAADTRALLSRVL